MPSLPSKKTSPLPKVSLTVCNNYMSEREEAVEAFKAVIATCDGAVQMCIQPPSSDLEEASPNIEVLHKDFFSILLLLRASTTKLSLAMKPSSPSYAAVLTPLKDSNNHLAALAHCVNYLRPATHGKYLAQEFARAAVEVINSVKSLLTVLADPEHLRDDTGHYFTRTGQVHDLIDTLRASGGHGLSESNLIAIRKKWLQDKGPLEDGLAEIHEILEEGSDDNEEDDGWDELGIDSGAVLSAEERTRVEKAQTLIKFTTALHARILRDLLNSSSLFSPHPTDLDTLAPHSSSLLSASDDFISSLHPTHDTQSIAEESASFRGVIVSLRSAVDTILVSAQLGQLKLEGDQTNVRAKWFRICFEQILKIIDVVSSSLS